MQVTVKGKNTAVPEKVRARAEHKLAKLERFDDRILAMEVEFTEERNPRVADPHRVEVTLTTKSGLVRAHANATDPAAAVDQVVDRLERQVKKLKGRRVDRTQHAEGVKAIPPLPPPEGSGEPHNGPAGRRSGPVPSTGAGEPHNGPAGRRSGPVPPTGAGEPEGGAPVDRDREELDETDQGKVMYRRGDGDASADEPEP